MDKNDEKEIHIQFLVIERDHRDLGAENPLNAHPEASDVGTKRVYEIDIRGTTDVSQISLEGMRTVPRDAAPVSKTLLRDVHEALPGFI